LAGASFSFLSEILVAERHLGNDAPFSSSFGIIARISSRAFAAGGGPFVLEVVGDHKVAPPSPLFLLFF